MGEDAAHNRGRRKGTTLLRAILASFRRKLVISGILLLGDSAVHVSQVINCDQPSSQLAYLEMASSASGVWLWPWQVVYVDLDAESGGTAAGGTSGGECSRRTHSLGIEGATRLLQRLWRLAMVVEGDLYGLRNI